MASIFPKISWILDGEVADQLTFNRPLKQIVDSLDNRINYNETLITDTNIISVSSIDTSKIDTDRIIIFLNGAYQDENCYTKQVNPGSIVFTFGATIPKYTVVKIITQ